jgi:hypothetical protein
MARLKLSWLGRPHSWSPQTNRTGQLQSENILLAKLLGENVVHSLDHRFGCRLDQLAW